MAALAGLPDFPAFQVLVLVSLGASAILVFLYLRRLGAERVGAFVGGLCFALGPYFVAHLADTATVVAAPLLPLVMLAAEDHLRRGTPARAAGLAASLALLLLAGSPEAARAGGALVAGRLIVGHALMPSPRGPSLRSSALALLAAGLLAAPQLLPTLVLAARGRPVGHGAGQPRSARGRPVRPRPPLRVAHAGGASGPGRAAPGPDPDPHPRARARPHPVPCPAVGTGPALRARRPRARLRSDAVHPGRALALRAVAGAARPRKGRGCAPTSWWRRWPRRRCSRWRRRWWARCRSRWPAPSASSP